jgi:uncharacterized protein
MMYWMSLTNNQSRSYLDSLAVFEKEMIELQKRTLDFVAPGEQQPEADHKMQMLNSNTGNTQDRFWRSARNEGYFSYEMATNSETGLSLIVRYRGGEQGNRKFDIYIDEEKLFSENNTGKWNQNKFQDIEYLIPDSFIKNKKLVRIKFQAIPGNTTGSVYYVRLARKKN